MKIGIITFHWAANHGAVLQTYALTKYLQKKHGAEVEVIDYCPKNQELSLLNAIKHIRARAAIRKLKELKKEKRIKPFREQLPISKRFFTNEQLKTEPLDYDVLITGSDQIWNPYFLMHGEKKVTPVYYLNFGGESVKKLSVSASFGCKELPKPCKEIVAPLLKQFSAISVRESTGAEIVRNLGIDDVCVTADPTALLEREDYLALCAENSTIKQGSVSKLILRKQDVKTRKLITAICEHFSEEKVNDLEFLSVAEWLAAIRDSGMVITNSFHCTMMCMKLHTPFVVLLENGTGAGMNDRFITLLHALGLENRIVTTVDEVSGIPEEIDYVVVDEKLGEYGQTLKEFLRKNIG